LRKQKTTEFQGSKKQISDKIREYKNTQISLKTLFATHKGYIDCDFYKKIQGNVTDFKIKHHSKNV
jgi:hypothetical protein